MNELNQREGSALPYGLSSFVHSEVIAMETISCDVKSPDAGGVLDHIEDIMARLKALAEKPDVCLFLLLNT